MEGDEVGASAGEGEDGVDPGEEGEGGLFRERQPLSFFAVDCRPKEQVGISGAYYCTKVARCS